MTDLVPYRKPYLTSEQLCTKLAEQGLKFEDEQAKKFAANRLSVSMIIVMDGSRTIAE